MTENNHKFQVWIQIIKIESMIRGITIRGIEFSNIYWHKNIRKISMK